MNRVNKFDKFIIFLYGLALMNLFSTGSYMLFICCIIFIIVDNRIVFDSNIVILLLFALFYFVFKLFNYNSSVLPNIVSSVRILVFPLSYIFGYQIKKNRGESSGNDYLSIVIFFSVAIALHGFLNFFYTLVTNGILGFGTGKYLDLFTGEATSSTGQTAYYYLLFSISGMIFWGNTKKTLKLFVTACALFALFHSVLCGVRISIVLFFASFFIGLLIRIRKERGISNFFKALFSLIIVMLCIVFIYKINLFNIQKVYRSSYLYYRLHSNYAIGFLQDDRFARKAIYLRNLLRYPFGGLNIRQGMQTGYAHGLLLDTYDDVGIVPTLLLTVYAASLLVRLIKKTIKNRDVNVSIFCGSLFLCLLIVFFTEPIIESCPLFFAAICAIDGIMNHDSVNAINKRKMI